MKFVTKRNVSDKIFSTQLSFGGFGESDLTAEEEQNLIEDLGAPFINLGQIEYKGKFLVTDDGKVAEDAADTTGEEVSFILGAKRIELKTGFFANYEVDCKRIPDAEVGTILNTKEKVAEAKCLLFEMKVKKAIKEAIDALKKRRTGFADVDVPDFVV